MANLAIANALSKHISGGDLSFYGAQNVTLCWLLNRYRQGYRNNIVQLDQGMGKTIIGVCTAVRQTVVVCEASQVYKWKEAFELWRPDLPVTVIEETCTDFNVHYEVLVISYAAMRLRRIRRPKMAIFDECHKLKDRDAITTRYSKLYSNTADNTLYLTGTLMRSRPDELWFMLRQCEIINSTFEEFALHFCDAYYDKVKVRGKYILEFITRGSSNEDELADIIQKHTLRLTKEKWLDLPARDIHINFFDYSTNSISKTDYADIQDFAFDAPPIDIETQATIRREVGEMALEDWVLDYLDDIVVTGEKLVILGHHVDVVNTIYQRYKHLGAVKVAGGTSAKDKYKAQQRFLHNPDCQVFVGNITSAGTGIDLFSACRLVFVEIPWTPAELHQGGDRIHRIGQTRDVVIELCVTRKSIQERALELIAQKDALANLLIKETILDTSKLAPESLKMVAQGLIMIGTGLLTQAEMDMQDENVGTSDDTAKAVAEAKAKKDAEAKAAKAAKAEAAKKAKADKAKAAADAKAKEEAEAKAAAEAEEAETATPEPEEDPEPAPAAKQVDKASNGFAETKERLTQYHKDHGVKALQKLMSDAGVPNLKNVSQEQLDLLNEKLDEAEGGE